MLTKFNDFLEPSCEISENGSGIQLVKSNFKLYNFDKICEQMNLTSLKSTDSIFIKDKSIFFIEFKSGHKMLNFKKTKVPNYAPPVSRELEIKNKILKYENKIGRLEKNELKDSLKLKIFDSLFYIFPRIFSEKTPLDFFKNLSEFNFFYIVIVGNEVDVCKTSNNKFHNRFRHLSTYKGRIEFDLKKYNNIFFKNIITENANFFDSKIVELLKS